MCWSRNYNEVKDQIILEGESEDGLVSKKSVRVFEGREFPANGGISREGHFHPIVSQSVVHG